MQSPRAESRVGRARAFGATALLALVALIGFGGAGCAESPSRSNLLLIVSDTLRADALSCQGGGAHTPNLCGLAEQGVLFENAFSNSSWTLPASVAMFTGNHPSEYVREREDAGDDAYRRHFLYVDDGEVMLAEALRARGYSARAYLENPIPARSNALQGFEEVDVETVDDQTANGVAEELGIDVADPRQRRLVPALSQLLDAGPEPFFVLQWLMDPHATYSPEAHRIEGLELDTGRLRQPVDFYTRLGGRHAPEEQFYGLKRLAGRLTLYERVTLKRLYLAEVESVDERVGTLLKALERKGLREDTLIVFTSDHGEGFGEHGWYLHGRAFHSEVVHVPLIIAGPGVRRGVRVPEPVSLVDLMPTLRELLHVDCLRADARGRTLRPVLEGSGGVEERAHYLVNAAPGHAGDALIRGTFKMMRTPGKPDEEPKLYDMENDPGERQNLIGEKPELAHAMRAELLAIREDNARRLRNNLESGDREGLEEVGEATLEQLRAIGYVD